MPRLWNDGWNFRKTDTECSYEEAVSGGGWKRVEIPHDWLIWQVNDLYETGNGWYRKTFMVTRRLKSGSADCSGRETMRLSSASITGLRTLAGIPVRVFTGTVIYWSMRERI